MAEDKRIVTENRQKENSLSPFLEVEKRLLALGGQLVLLDRDVAELLECQPK